MMIGSALYFWVLRPENHSESSHQEAIYTCSMHPQIIRNEAGDCPICGMPLIEKVSTNQAIDSNSIEHLLQPTENFVVGNYETTSPKDSVLSTEVLLPGIVAYDPKSSVNIAARISGRIEKMYVNYKFQKVTKGQKLFDLYSPELLTEQQNFLYLLNNDSANTAILKASKQKLALYGMTTGQINSLAAAKKVNAVISIYSPSNGIVEGTESMSPNNSGNMSNSSGTTENLSIKEGDYIKKNELVFKLINTDKVWGIFNIIQGYNSLVKVNQAIKITSELEDTDFITAKVDFIETQLNPGEKTNRIRVYLNNQKLKFPIGLRLEASVKTNPIKGVWVPKQALVSIGTQKIVYLKMKNGFTSKKIKIGFEINNLVQVLEGISVQDTIVANAQYLIDSESFIKTE